jgi:hypothetical protein
MSWLTESRLNLHEVRRATQIVAENETAPDEKLLPTSSSARIKALAEGLRKKGSGASQKALTSSAHPRMESALAGWEVAQIQEPEEVSEFVQAILPALATGARMAGAALLRGGAAVARGAAAVGRGALRLGGKAVHGVISAAKDKAKDVAVDLAKKKIKKAFEPQEESFGLTSDQQELHEAGWLPAFSDVRRLSGIQEESLLSQEDLDWAAYLAALGEMVDVDFKDMMRLSESDQDRIANSLQGAFLDEEQVREAALRARMNGAEESIHRLISYPDQAAKARDIVLSLAEKSENWIVHAIKKPGALHKSLKVPQGKKIPVKKLKSASKGSTKKAKRARLALILRKLHHP